MPFNEKQVTLFSRVLPEGKHIVACLFVLPFYINLTTVTHAVVTACLDYCNVLCMGLPLKSVQKRQLLQNVAARLLTGAGAGYRDHVIPLLQQLH